MKVAIVGGSGFIGTNLADLFIDRGVNFTILDKAKSEKYAEKWMYCDVTDYASLIESLAEHDIIINLAAEHKDNVRPISLYYQVNVEGAKNICKAADELNIKNIVLTSDSEGLPMSALEAATAGLPLVLSDVGGCNEIIDGNGLLVTNSESSLVSALENIFTNYAVFYAIAQNGKGKFDINNKKDEYRKIILGC